MLELIVLVVIGTSIWVAFDAAARGLSWTWALGCLDRWILAFPWYLVERRSGPKMAERGPHPPLPSAPETDLQRLQRMAEGRLNQAQNEAEKRQLARRRGD